jgi:hypothetical protein
MLLNAKNNQFVFRFPRNFINKKIEEKYNFYLKRLPTPFENILDYVNHTIQSVTFPSVGSDEVEQFIGRKTSVDGKNITKNPQYWRQSLDMSRILPKDFTVNLKAADAYLNYWVLFEVYKDYIEVTNTEDYFPDMSLMYLDREGYQLLTVDMKQPIMKGISEVEMNYSATAMEFRTFSVNFKYNTFEINVKLD